MYCVSGCPSINTWRQLVANTEVNDLNLEAARVAPGNHYILWLEITMDPILRVNVFHAQQDLFDYLSGSLFR